MRIIGSAFGTGDRQGAPSQPQGSKPKSENKAEGAKLGSFEEVLRQVMARGA